MTTENVIVKRGKELQTGDWVEFGRRFWIAIGRPYEVDGMIYAPAGYGLMTFRPNGKVRVLVNDRP